MKNENISNSNQKGLIDFLWEWADKQGLWAKLLVAYVTTGQGPLSDDDIQTVYNEFKKSIGLINDNNVVEIIKPSCSFENSNIKLLRISKITGVNRLSDKTVIEFSPNLTILYGENGAGKSGFSRILKNIGFSYDNDKKVLNNVYSANIDDQSAVIDYTKDDSVQFFNWDGVTSNDELKSISVFTNACVNISLGDNRNLIVTPLGFHLFDIVSRELDKLSTKLQVEVKSFKTKSDWFELLHENTPQKKFVDTLSSRVTEESLLDVTGFSSSDEQKLSKIDKELNSLTPELIKKQITDLSQQINEIKDLRESIEENQKLFSKEQWDLLYNYSCKIKELEEQGKSSLSEIAKEKGIEFFESSEFEQFIRSADNYIKLLDNDLYPEGHDVRCIYCNQLLSDEKAKDLLKDYKKVLRDTTESELKWFSKLYNDLEKIFNSLNDEFKIHYFSFGVLDDSKPVQPQLLLNYCSSLKVCKEKINQKCISKDNYDLDYPMLFKLFQDKEYELLEAKRVQESNLENLSSKIEMLNNLKSELIDKKILFEKRDDIKEIIKSFYIIDVLNQNSSKFNTSTLSTKTSQARKELIESNFSDTFINEMESLRKSNFNIELNFGTSKGATNIKQKIKSNYKLTDILSEGEQKAIALAEFFSEIKIDGSSSPVVFDDPVNSLDHHIIDDVARRLIRLSQERQTIVFTHSILLFNAFLYFSKQQSFKNINFKFYSVEKNYDICGFVSELNDELNSSAKYIKKINTLINNPAKERPEADVAAEGYGYLRSAIELSIEQDIFKDSVKRYQKNVALTNFAKVSGEKIDRHKDKINEIFERCCGFITGHSNPIEIACSPCIIDLKNDFESYKKIREEFI